MSLSALASGLELLRNDRRSRIPASSIQSSSSHRISKLFVLLALAVFVSSRLFNNLQPAQAVAAKEREKRGRVEQDKYGMSTNGEARLTLTLPPFCIVKFFEVPLTRGALLLPLLRSPLSTSPSCSYHNNPSPLTLIALLTFHQHLLHYKHLLNQTFTLSF